MKTKISLILLLLSYSLMGQVTIDSTFGQNGMSITRGLIFSYSGVNMDWLKLRMLSTGNMVQTTSYGEGLLGLTKDGLIDTAFGDSGTAILNIPGYSNQISEVIDIDASDNIYSAYTTVLDSNFKRVIRILKFNSSGNIDSSFNGVGFVHLTDIMNDCQGQYFSSIKILPSGDFLISGNRWCDSSLFLFKVLSSGQLDTTFGNQGVSEFYSTQFRYMTTSFDIQADGKIVLVGGRTHKFIMNSPAEAFATRFNNNGSLDTSYGNAGKEMLNIYQFGHALPSDVKILANQKALITGRQYYPNPVTNVFLMRINPNAQLDTTFGIGGVTYLSEQMYNPNFTETNPSIGLMSDDRIVLGAFNLYRFTNNGVLDSTCHLAKSDTTLFVDAHDLVVDSLNRVTSIGNGAYVYGTKLTRFHADLTLANGSNSFTDSACAKYIFNGKEYRNSGQYQDTLQTTQGCDSIVYLDVTITTVDNSVTQSGSIFTAPPTSTSYQWINCASMQTIPGETMQTYTATANGSYAVIVTENGCTDTSACYTINNVDLPEMVSTKLQIYPNPNSGSFSIAFEEITSGSLEIYTINGQRVYHQEVEREKELDLQLNIAKGVYFLRLEDQNLTITKRLMIQ